MLLVANHGTHRNLFKIDQFKHGNMELNELKGRPFTVLGMYIQGSILAFSERRLCLCYLHFAQRERGSRWTRCCHSTCPHRLPLQALRGKIGPKHASERWLCIFGAARGCRLQIHGGKFFQEPSDQQHWSCCNIVRYMIRRCLSVHVLKPDVVRSNMASSWPGIVGGALGLQKLSKISIQQPPCRQRPV